MTSPVPEGNDAFTEIYRQHATPVYRFCLTLTGNPADAEDAAAEAFAKAFIAFSRRPPDDVHSWLFRIARNVVVDQHRRRQARHRLLGLVGRSEPSGTTGDPGVSLAVRQDLRELIDILGALRRRDRELIALRVTTDMTFAQIGKALGMSERGAKLATYRALAKLREMIPEESTE